MRLINLALRLGTRRRLAGIEDLLQARAELERGAPWLALPPRLLALPLVSGGVSGLSVRVGVTPPGRIVLYFHGGAYIAGTAWFYRALAGRLAARARCEVIVPEYRRAPEHPLTAAFADALSAWDGLMAAGYAPGQVVLAGDSAGGGLALALLGVLCARATVPAGLVAFSPWTDLSAQSPSLRENARRDPVLPVEKLAQFTAILLRGLQAQDPRISPLFAEFPNPPPVLLQHSFSEILCDDSLRMADRLRAFGGSVEVQSWPNTPHAWQLFGGLLPEADAALDAAGQFIAARFDSPIPPPGDS